MDAIADITIGIFVVGLAFYSGVLSARVDALEKWRDEMREDVKSIRSTTDQIAGALRQVS